MVSILHLGVDFSTFRFRVTTFFVENIGKRTKKSSPTPLWGHRVPVTALALRWRMFRWFRFGICSPTCTIPWSLVHRSVCSSSDNQCHLLIVWPWLKNNDLVSFDNSLAERNLFFVFLLSCTSSLSRPPLASLIHSLEEKWGCQKHSWRVWNDMRGCL